MMRNEAAFNQLIWVDRDDAASMIRRVQIAKISRTCRLDAEAAVADAASRREEQQIERFGRLSEHIPAAQLDEIGKRWREKQEAGSRARGGRAAAAEISAVVDGGLVISRCLRQIELAGGGTIAGEELVPGDLPDGDFCWLLEAIWEHTYPADDREGNSSGS